jgi:hypothetical protein
MVRAAHRKQRHNGAIVPQTVEGAGADYGNAIGEKFWQDRWGR